MGEDDSKMEVSLDTAQYRPDELKITVDKGARQQGSIRGGLDVPAKVDAALSQCPAQADGPVQQQGQRVDPDKGGRQQDGGVPGGAARGEGGGRVEDGEQELL